jgi:predicted TIM-barrel fold metal-dependent hydrolase|tara:strand:- start:584 stop:1615 length:1032 start_codon:yes stop_codon:yes gene_type:complete
MPFGGNDWLDLTIEETLEPDLPICDPHHHFWDHRLERIPYQEYLLPQLVEDITSGHNVTSTVFIEARSMYRQNAPDHMKPIGEVEFVQGLAAASASGIYGDSRAAAAIVGHANLNLGSKVREVLEALKEASPKRFRGIRHSVTWDPHPEIENTALHKNEGQMLTKNFQDGAKVLADMGLTFEAWMYSHQLGELVDLAKTVPDLKIILNHVGGLVLDGPYESIREEVLANWRDRIKELSECPNVVVKLGGIGMPRTGFDWHLRQEPIGSEELASQMGPLLNYCIEQFGPERGMFESNFPVDKVSYSYNILYNAFKIFSKDYSPAERALMFRDNAIDIYSVDESL